VKLSLEGMIEMISSVEINSERMKEGVYRNFSTATDLADYLVKKGVPFRESHEISGRIVRYCETEKKDFFKLTHDELKVFSTLIDEEIKDTLDPEKATERKLSIGSTSTDSVLKQIDIIKKMII